MPRADHNGWHAYRHIVAEVNLTSDLNWWSRPNGDESAMYITKARKERIVQIIEQDYGVELTEEDKSFILGMRTPRQLCVDFANRFSPSNYPALRSDFPAET